MRVLLIYASRGGRADNIAKRMAARMSQEGAPTDLYNVANEPADEITIDAYDAVMLGSPMHNDHYDRRIEWCIREYRRFLSEIPTAFFSVRHLVFGANNSGNQKPQLADEIDARLHWQPSMKQTFSCAERYPSRGLLKSRLMHWLTEIGYEEVEADCKDEPNIWDSVNEFASRFTQFIRSCKQPPDTRPRFTAWSDPTREYSVLPSRGKH